MDPKHFPKTSLIILSGGQSLRLGTDKGLYRPLGEESLINRGINLWHDLFDEILVVVRDEEQAQDYRLEMLSLPPTTLNKVRVVYDTMTHGPAARAAMVGMLTGLTQAKNSITCVLPVDQLGVRKLHLKNLIEAATDHPLRPSAFFSEDQYFVFPSIWPKVTIERLHILAEGGAFGLQTALERFEAAKVDPGPHEKSLQINGNTKQEITEALGHEILQDPHGRKMRYLRLSLTEACNMSCTYCLPEGFPEWYRHRARLSFQDVQTILKGFRHLGFQKIRLTGGEPTIHPDHLKIIGAAKDIGFETIAMTTNGVKIPNVRPYVDAGLNQINISLDSLAPDTFKGITKNSNHAAIMDLIQESIDLGIKVKINTVLLRTKNYPELESLIDWALERSLTLRFIELMPTGLNREFHERERILNSEIQPYLKARGLHREPPQPGTLGGPSVDWSGPYPGKIGLISPLSCNFCDLCNRLRVTAKGALKLCLFGDHDHPLTLQSPEELAAQVKHLLHAKGERHHLEEGQLGNVNTFRTIGG